MGSTSWNGRKQRVKHSDFRNASTSGFTGNLIRIELLDMVHGVYGVNLSDFPSVREWFHPGKDSIRRETDNPLK